MAVTPTQVQQIINQNSAMQGGQPFGRGGTGMTQQEGPIPDLPPDWNPDANPPINQYGGVGTGQEGPVPSTNGNPYGGPLDILDPTGRYQIIAPTKYHGWLIFDKATGGYRAPTADEMAAISGASGGTAADHYATDVSAASQAASLAERQREFEQQIALNQQQLAEQQRQFGITNPQEELQRQQSYLQQRAGVGENLATLQRGLAQDAYQRALDPGNFPAYLAASAGLPQGRSAIDQLLGSGAQINSPAGSNPLADPRFQSLIDELYGYAKPTSLSTVQQIAAQNGGQLPQSFYDYTGTQNPNVQQHAAGGSQMLHEPVIGIGLHSGQPQFLAGEAGPERLQFQPTTHSHSDGGMPIPHSHADGHKSHDHMDANSPARYAEGGTADIQPYGYDQPNPDYERVKQAYATNPEAAQRFFSQNPENLAAMFGTPAGTYTPAQGTSIALGKGLQQFGWVPQPLIQQLLAGNAPTSGSVDEATLMRLPPSYRQLLQAAIRARVGTAGLQDYGQSQQQYALPGLGTSFASASYQ